MMFLRICETLTLLGIAVSILFGIATIRLMSDRIDSYRQGLEALGECLLLLNMRLELGPNLDFPHVRHSLLCPLCDGPKVLGLVACWPCYREFNLRYGTPKAAAEMIRAREAELSRAP